MYEAKPSLVFKSHADGQTERQIDRQTERQADTVSDNTCDCKAAFQLLSFVESVALHQ